MCESNGENHKSMIELALAQNGIHNMCSHPNCTTLNGVCTPASILGRHYQHPVPILEESRGVITAGREQEKHLNGYSSQFYLQELETCLGATAKISMTLCCVDQPRSDMNFHFESITNNISTAGNIHPEMTVV